MRLRTRPSTSSSSTQARCGASILDIVVQGQTLGSRHSTWRSGCSSASRFTRWISVPIPIAVPGAAASTVRMMKSVEPDQVRDLDDLVGALGVDHDQAAGVRGAERRHVGGPEALVHRAVPPPQQERRLLDLDVLEAARGPGAGPRRPSTRGRTPWRARCSARGAGRGRRAPSRRRVGRAGRPSAHSRTLRAFDDVHTAPPWRPTKALSAAVEFMYVIGTTRSRSADLADRVHASSTWSMSAMSAIEHPARGRAGRPAGRAPVKMSADSAMKCTPQKTTNSASWRSAASRDRPKLSPRASAQRITSSFW